MGIEAHCGNALMFSLDLFPVGNFFALVFGECIGSHTSTDFYIYAGIIINGFW